jgi:hypothetical protein
LERWNVYLVQCSVIDFFEGNFEYQDFFEVEVIVTELDVAL